MPINELFFVLRWWLIFLILGLIFLPLTSRIFSSFFDKGYIFSKIVGLLLISFAVWLLASLKIMPFSLISIFLVFIIFFLINIKLFKTYELLKSPIFLLEEAVFLICLIFWSYIKGFEPSIHGLEKFMDFGFINSILKSDSFPPKDMWLSPETINYYYFGHFQTALLTKISFIKPEITYNLTIASLFALCFTASFSISANLYYFFLSSSSKLQATRYKLLIIFSGLIGAFLVTLGGNLHTIYIFFQSYATENPYPFWTYPMMINFDGYWYPNATRFIPFTIHEFPLYSFVVSDLHGHVLSIPLVLLLLALLIHNFFSPDKLGLKLNALRYSLYALLISSALMTNFLDGPIYLLVIFIVFIAKDIFIIKNKSFFDSLVDNAYRLILIAVLSILFSLPFWLNFKPFGSGIGVICAPDFLINLGKLGPFLFEANHCARSPIWMLLILWGFPLFVFLVFIFSKFKLNARRLTLNATDLLALTLSITAFILILIPEFLYVKDIYPAHWRANTVFKFGYQAFIILGLMSGYFIVRLFVSLKNKIIFYIIVALFCLPAIYPIFAVNSYFGGLKNYKGLDGLTYLKELYPTDYQAILWLNQNIKGQPVILEAQGDSYTDYARVSSNTGLPTVIGWPVHEWLWRGSYDVAGIRIPDVTAMYESNDLRITSILLKKYGVQYVFIGSLESQKYPNLNEEKFKTLGKLVFESSATKIYQIN